MPSARALSEADRPLAERPASARRSRAMTPPKRSRLPRTSASTAPGGSRLTTGVNCSAQRPRRSSSAASAVGLCSRTRSPGTRASAAFRPMPGAMPWRAARSLQATTARRGSSAAVTTAARACPVPSTSASSGRRGKWAASQSSPAGAAGSVRGAGTGTSACRRLAAAGAIGAGRGSDIRVPPSGCAGARCARGRIGSSGPRRRGRTHGP